MEELGQFDITALNEMDPSLEGGFRVQFDREIPIELRVTDQQQSPDAVGTVENVRIKVLSLGEQQTPQILKIELTSENDLFFNYVSIIDEEQYRRIKAEQKLTIQFNQFFSMIIKLLNSSLKEPNQQQALIAKHKSFFSVFFMEKDGQARLDVIENLEYKFLELLSLDFIAAPEENVRQNVTFRFNLLKAKMLFVQNRLNSVASLIKLKNPSLLLSINKSASSTLGQSQIHQSSQSRFIQNSSKKNASSSRFGN